MAVSWQWLRTRLRPGDARRRVDGLAAEHIERDDSSAALALLRDHGIAEAAAAAQVADLLLVRDRVDDAIAVLRDCAERAEPPAERTLAARSLAYLLAEHGRTDELRERARAGDPDAAERLVMWLLERDRATDLRAHVSSGGVYVSDRIILALRRKGYRKLADLAVRRHPEQVGYASAEPLVAEMERQGRYREAIPLLRAFAERSPGAAQRLLDLCRKQGDAAGAAEAYRLQSGTLNDYNARPLIGLFLKNGRMDDAMRVLRDHPNAADRFTTSCLVELMIVSGSALDALSVLRRRPERWAAEHLADLESRPDRIEIVRASPDEAAAMVDRTIDAGDIDRALALLRVRAAGGDPRAAERLAALRRDRANDPKLRSIDLLMSTLYDLRVGRDLGPVPYSIQEWERGRVPDPGGDADARLAAALRDAGAVPRIPGGELPKPAFISTSRDRLYTELHRRFDDDMSYEVRETPGYHWDVRDEHGIGAYFDASVNSRGEAEFSFVDDRYPATPDGWRALMSAVNDFGDSRKHIHLFVNPYAD
ncbi:tetratricopeptide repeat protein [Actinomadura sp. 9N407]|uniref:tetratricopeptide repeat protein n=1 Tax=Actinomadura sp. 9N407 TaxID=3375154 RepID=UPI0037922236